MFNLFKKIMPKEERFFEMFDRHAACVLAGAGTLREMLDRGATGSRAVPEADDAGE